MDQDTYIIDDIPGSLSNIYEIKILICCTINDVKKPFTRYQLNEVFQFNETVNYFNFCQAMTDLLKTKHIIEKSDNNKNSNLYLTNLGKETAITLKNALPKSTLEKTIKKMNDLIEKERQNKGKTVEIKKQDDGYIVKLIIEETGSNIMDLELFSPTKESATKMAKKLSTKTIDIYNCIFALITNDHKAIENIAKSIKHMTKI